MIWDLKRDGEIPEQVKETMHTLSELLQAPDPKKLNSFICRLPVIFNVVIFSPHGYFGQADVLGLPDTGGQVINHTLIRNPATGTITSNLLTYFCIRWFTSSIKSEL